MDLGSRDRPQSTYLLKKADVVIRYAVDAVKFRCYRDDVKMVDNLVLNDNRNSLHTPCLKNRANCFCHKFVEFSSTLIIFGATLVNGLKLYEVHCTHFPPQLTHINALSCPGPKIQILQHPLFPCIWTKGY